MPVRDAERAYDLRGMDIAFLMEAAEERRLARMMSNAQGSTVFSNTLNMMQVQDLADKISAVIKTGEVTLTGPANVDWLWYEGSASELTSDLLQQYPVWLSAYQD